ncbi:hypothetical protein TeGR_g2256 [Tetraparma gracilis]|uniref:Uncharacterized protein n=1 Tax=Tetraparma gracilis TaxID=2962635 RepID=A0ABQ6MRB9_9STRA|nr:hypothetical protein TeGR_g2256 [Tetraparma gracilis]
MSTEESAFLATRNARLQAASDKATSRAAEKQASTTEEESTAAFLESFRSTLASARSTLSLVPSSLCVTSKKRADALSLLSSISQSCASLRLSTASASHFLNPFDVRSCEQRLAELLADAAAAKAQCVPRKKFTFKSRRGADGEGDFVQPAAPPPAAVSSDRSVLTDTSDAAVSYEIEHDSDSLPPRSSLRVLPPPLREPAEAYSRKTMRLKGLEGCTLTLLDVYGLVRLQHLSDCTVYLGAVTGPVYVENVKNCKIFAYCRQLRIHETRGTDFYVHTGSGPIVENCDGCRDNAVARFRTGETWVLIATDVIARGLDFKAVNLVINFDFPNSGVSYVHRIGRTGRNGRKGKAITLFTEDDFPALRSIANIMKLSGCDVPEWQLKMRKERDSDRKRREQFGVRRNDAGVDTATKMDKSKKNKKRRFVENAKRKPPSK